MIKHRLDSLDIGANINISITNAGKWTVSSGKNSFPLDNIKDFFRIWRILEKPFSESQIALTELAKNGPVSSPFPYWKLIASTFSAESRQWAEHSLGWIPHLSIDDKILLKPFLTEASRSEWISQPMAKTLNKYIQDI
ncbi:hypothetical protein [Flavisphingomonas formosensis]|uniref:hypothetical protein n=1 Tax=Flavisphingomonas formosensis TaxID=861534 RepID=UPI0012FC7C07|nr:hypothetical protein [Sphingomonas formosensis]